MAKHPIRHNPSALIEHWLDVMVIGLNLCPFAYAARRSELVRIVETDSARSQNVLQQLVDEAYSLSESNEERTTLLVLSQGFESFDDYLDLLGLAEALLSELGFDGILQIASFHPHYQFEGSDNDNVSNWTNRAPLPILQLLLESSVSRAVEQHPDPESIPERNIERLDALGLDGITRLMHWPPTSDP